MSSRRYVNLDEILAVLEEEESNSAPATITLLPPNNACEELTDEDSGEVGISNLPRSQLLAGAEVVYDDGFDFDDDIPLSAMVPKKRKMDPKKKLTWTKEDLQGATGETIFSSVFNNQAPIEIFEQFFDDGFYEMAICLTNNYAMQKNIHLNVSLHEIKSFFGILLLSGYNVFPCFVNAIMSNLHFCDNHNLQRPGMLYGLICTKEQIQAKITKTWALVCKCLTSTIFFTSLDLLSELKERGINATVYDAWGKFPSGILLGNLFDVGNFDQCVRLSVNLGKIAGVANGQYCFAAVPLTKDEGQNEFKVRTAPMVEARGVVEDFLKIRVGICVPDTCSPEFLTTVFQAATSKVFNGALEGTSVSSCTNGKTPDLRMIDIVAVTIFSIILTLMISSSIYDFFMTCFEKTPIPVLLAFSILTNGKKLFAINTKESPNTIDCLTGIRVFSMIWVMYSHVYGFTAIVPILNSVDMYWWLKKPWSMHVVNATISVDSFFFISGVLVAWLGFRELDKTKGKLNVVMMYVHRYIRLTAPLAGGLLFLLSLSGLVGTGPFRQNVLNLNQCDGNNWWPVLLYIQNYFVQETRCYSETWYLAIDFQLYILSPLLLIPMWKWGKKFAPVLITLALLSIGCVIATFFTQGFSDLRGFDNLNEWEKTYTPTHTRYSPWLVGFGLGYFMHINRQKTFRLPKIVQLIGWIASFTTLVSILFAPYFTIISRGHGTVFEAAMYESLKRVSWAIALAWITFACHFGFGGVVDAFLSHPFWQPLGRLTYSLYLVHITVFTINFGMMRTSVYFYNYGEILYFWSTFGSSLMAAIALTLAFESPVLVLEKAIFGKGKEDKQTRVRPVVFPHDVVVEVPHKYN